MGLNSPKDAKIITLTLNSEQTNDLIKKTNDTQIPLRNIYKESIYEKFLLTNNSSI